MDRHRNSSNPSLAAVYLDLVPRSLLDPLFRSVESVDEDHARSVMKVDGALPLLDHGRSTDPP